MIKILSFDEDLSKIFNFSLNYHKPFFKKDIYHLTIVFIFSFIYTLIFFFIGAMILHNRFYTIDIDISAFEDPFLSGILYANIIGIIFSDLLIGSFTIIGVSFLVYEYFWLIYSKSFDVIKSNNEIEELNEIKTISYLKSSIKIFIGAISSFFLTSFVILFFIFILRYFFLSINILNGPNAAFSFLSVILIIIVPFILSGYFLFPTLIYPIVLIVEDKPFISALKKVYTLFSGKKIKLKFLILFTALFFISFTLFGFLVIVVSFIFIILRAVSLQDLILFIILFSAICSFCIVVFIEILSNLFGNLYAQIYLNLISHKTKVF